MPRKSSTNTRALSTRIANIQKEVSPIIAVTPVRSQPKAIVSTTDRWVPRLARVVLGGAGAVTLTVGQVVKALGFNDLTSDRAQLKVLAIKAWNMTNAGSSTGFLNVVTGSILTLSSVVQSGEDFGNATSSPGMKLNIPDTLAASINLDPTSAGTIATATGQPAGITSTAVQTFVFDVTVMFRV